MAVEEEAAPKEEEAAVEAPQDLSVVDEQEAECDILNCEFTPVANCIACACPMCPKHTIKSQDELHVACSTGHLPLPGSVPVSRPSPPEPSVPVSVKRGGGHPTKVLATKSQKPPLDIEKVAEDAAELARRVHEYDVSTQPRPPPERSIGDIAAEANAWQGLDTHAMVTVLTRTTGRSSAIS